MIQGLQQGLLMRRQGLGERHESPDPFHGDIVDRQDNVVLFKSSLSQNAARIKRCDGDAVVGRQAVFLTFLRGQGTNHDTQTIFKGRGHFLDSVFQVADRHRQIDGLVVPHDGQADRLAHGCVSHTALKIRGILDFFCPDT